MPAITNAQRLKPLAFSGSRLENALRQEPRSQQYSAPLTFLFTPSPNKNQRYETGGNISLLVVTTMGCALKGLGPILPSQSTFKNFRSEVFLFPMSGAGDQKNQLKTGKFKKTTKRWFCLKMLSTTKSHLAFFFFLIRKHTHT